MKKRLSELARSIDAREKPGWDGVYVSRVIADSRLVEPGDLFVALRGVREDGHAYLEEAVANGAVAIVTERRCGVSVPELTVPDGRSALARLAAELHDRPTEGLFVVGVTGTNGKTTVCHLAAQVLGETETELISTVTNESRGLPGVTTPESPIVQTIARRAADEGKVNLVIEASSIGLSQKRLEAIDFDIAVFTNLTRDHLDYHRDREDYLAAKLSLFQDLRESAVALINSDDPASRRVAGSTRAKVMTYAIHGEGDLRAEDIEYSPRSSSFTLRTPVGSIRLRIPFPAEHNVSNALAAAGVGIVRGLNLERIADALSGAGSIPGRYQVFRARSGAEVIVDFAHSPDSLERTLTFLRANHRRVISLFGCPGESDRGKRPLMGRISGELAAITIVTTDNPKGEDPASIADQIEVGIRGAGGSWERILDRKDAIRRAIGLSEPGDAVLIAGKGHEMYQIVGREFVPHNDASFLIEEGLVQGPDSACG